MRILVVEDDFISRRLLCRYLEPYGECDVAVNGREAIQAVRRALNSGPRYDLVCLDIMMPDMDGQQTLREIRILEKEGGVAPEDTARVIMTTALEDHVNVMKAFRSQCDGYVVKPIERKRLLQILHESGLPVTTGEGR
ncbi:MAG: response regulator [Candidatus Krumholzibacteriia bacterium]